MKGEYNVVIVGAGPAGLFAAYELQKSGIGNTLLLEKGKRALSRTPQEVLWGVGGAGLFSDGKLNFTSRLGKTDLTEFLPLEKADDLISEVEIIFKEFGMDGQTYPANKDEAQAYRAMAQKLGLELQLIKQKHLGSDNLPGYIARMEKFLESKGVDVVTECEALEILKENEAVIGLKTSQGEVKTQTIIAAPGRAGNHWLSSELKRLGLTLDQKAIEIGVRVETSAEILREICSVIYDPTFYLHTQTFDDQLRTFCTNPTGFVAAEKYKEFVCVNGHAYSNKHSQNANFALLDKVSLTEPVTDTIAYGESICKLASTIGAGKPILQRYVDFKRHRRSTWERLAKSYIEPTLKEVTPGDIGMALPYRIVTNLIEGIEKLDKMIPGLAGDATLLYAPEVKFFSVRPKVTDSLETQVNGLFVAGDGAGISGNIVGAAATGIIAARGVIAKNASN
jgi:uncharacterized FAD-dependent dehydrogenase